MKAKYAWALFWISLFMSIYLMLGAFDILSVNEYVGYSFAGFVLISAPVAWLIGIGSGMRWNGRKKV